MRYFAVDCSIDAYTASVTVGAKEHAIDPPVAVANEADALCRISAPQRWSLFIQAGVINITCVLLKQCTSPR